MKKTFLSFTFLIAVNALPVSGVAAQITINIPGIKKIIKKPDVRTNVETTTPDPNDTTTNTTTATGRTDGTTSGNWWIDYQIEAITKYKVQVESWDPETQIFPKPNSSDDYISVALSKKERASWIREKKIASDARLDAALDDLKTSLTRRMPEYKINPKSFTHRNAAEETLLLAELSDVPGLKVFKVGFNQPTWLIDKNEWGIPKARYKHGLVYGRNPASEDPFCRIWYVNVVQEYSGAGTYGPTQARYIEKEFIACPAGQ
ncbi:MAG TPA: hypothetical protein VFZ23_12965 [Pyrinomonadaceae bacterium]